MSYEEGVHWELGKYCRSCITIRRSLREDPGGYHSRHHQSRVFAGIQTPKNSESGQEEDRDDMHCNAIRCFCRRIRHTSPTDLRRNTSDLRAMPRLGGAAYR
jgi:hypothetical protein